MENRTANKRIDSLIEYVASVGSACLIVMWSVFNTWLNVLQFRASPVVPADAADKLTDDGPAWWITAIMVLITCVVPFLLGLFLFFMTLNRAGKKSR